MDLFDVLPELALVMRVAIPVDAHLSKIFHHDLSSIHLGMAGVHSAVLATSVAVLFDVVFVAVLTEPEDEPWSHQDLGSESSVDRVEIMHEIKGHVIAARIPDIIFYPIVRSGDVELGEYSHLCQFILSSILQESEKFVSVFLRNKE